MLRSIAFRVSASNFVLLLLIFAVIGATTVVLRKQADDGLVVNLSGRQRMLTQRMTHQLLAFERRTNGGQDTEIQRQAVLQSLQVFERTLDALDHGGPAPLDLQMANMRSAPTASPTVSRQLGKVRQLYQGYQAQARQVLDGSLLERTSAVDYLIQNNTELLNEMNTAVSIMQMEAEGRVRQLYLMHGAAALLAIVLFWTLTSFVHRTVVHPLRSLAMHSDAISRGEVTLPVDVGGPTELTRLGGAVERLRVAMRNLLASHGPDELAGL
jgi:methyl-accepting chemotaxis protein